MELVPVYLSKYFLILLLALIVYIALTKLMFRRAELGWLFRPLLKCISRFRFTKPKAQIEKQIDGETYL
jgi:hypothetical protein